MTKGNNEIRFRAKDEIHAIGEQLQNELGIQERAAAYKLLIQLGNDQVKNAVNYLDSITHPLTNGQFENFMLALKIRVKQKREERKQRKTPGFC